MRRIALRCLLIGVASIAALLLLEAAARWLRIAPPLVSQYGGYVADPYLPYKNRPLSKLNNYSASGEFTIEYAHNSLGFRAQEHAVVKPAGTFRIVVLGDSFTYGAGAAFDDTYPAQLERLLNARPGAHARVELINLGIPRYFPAPERLALEAYGLAFQPDLVLIGIVPNDVIDTYLGLDAITVSESGVLLSRDAKRLGNAGTWLYLHSHVARILLSRWVTYASQRDWPIRSDDVYRADGFHEAAWQTMEADLERIQHLVQKHGAKLLLAGIPHNGPWNEKSVYPDRRLAAWSERHGAIFVATIPALRDASAKGPTHWPIDGHCNANGYAAIARAIFTELERRDAVP